MRLAFFGNTCNNLYQIAKALRATSNFDTHLYLDSASGPQELPESDDPELALDYPDWIHRGRYVGIQSILAPWTSPLVKIFDSYDALVVSGYGPMIAHYTRKPTFFLATGSDLTIWPFPLRYISLFSSLPKKAGQILRGLWQRRGIRSCTEIWAQQFLPFRQAIQRLQIEQSIVSSSYFPMIIDEKKFAYDERQLERSELARMLRQRYDFIIFHPSRMMIQDNHLLRETGNWKANDVLIRGFARFLQKPGVSNSCLVLIDRPASKCSPRAKKLIAELEIETSVVWLKPPQELGFTRDELIPLYCASDVVADDFGAGWFGSVVVEALSLKRAVVSYVDEDAMRQLYPWHPIVGARTDDEVGHQLWQLYANPELRLKAGLEGRRWVEEFHSSAGAGRIYVRRFEELADRLAQREIVRPAR